MTYNDHDGRRRSGAGRSGSPSSRQRSYGQGPQLSSQGPYHGPRGTRQRGNGLRTPSRGGSGYPLRARNINFQSGRARRLNGNRRLLILGALAIVLVILVVVLISSCVRSCSADQQASEANPVDARVAAGVSEELTREFAGELDRGEHLAQIAQNASKYSDQGLLELALAQPSAIDFVLAYPDAEKSAQPYDDSVSQGTVPELYCWDARWGNVDYAGRAFALTGSGPTVLSMAYMGLTGSADRSPADIAQLVTDAGMASGDSGMSAEFLTSSLGDLGLSCTDYASNADNLAQVLDSGTYLLLETSAGSALGDNAHWVIAVTENEDGSVVLLDPTEPENSSHSWDAATTASSTTTLYAISAAKAEGDAAATE